MTRRILALGIVLALAAVVTVEVTAEQRVLVLKGGRGRIQGEITKTKDGYEVKLGPGSVVIIAADQVLRVEAVGAPVNRLKEQLSRINRKDPEALYKVAKWAADNDLLTEARDLLTEVLALNPNHRQAQLRLKIVNARLNSAATTRRPPPSTKGSENGGEKIKIDPKNLLTREDIYRIRLMELQSGDAEIAIEFRNKVLDRFIEANKGIGVFADRGGERKFRAAAKVKQVRYILQNTDRNDHAIRDDIIIKRDPSVLHEFRIKVWPIVAANCATLSCHGGVKGAGKLKLFNAPTKDDSIVYTNFYILHAWSRGGRKLINRERAEMSLLLQYGLPDKLARMPHPKRPGGAKPAFLTNRSRNYKLVERWIANLSYPFVSPGYRIRYTAVPGMPKKRTTTQPSIFD